MSDDFVRNLKEPSHWLRVFFMLGFAVVLYVAGIVLLVITVAQLLFSLLTGVDNRNLRALGASLATYVHDILKYLTYNSEDKPFPFAPFPFVEPGPDPEPAIQPDPFVPPEASAATAWQPVDPVPPEPSDPIDPAASSMDPTIDQGTPDDPAPGTRPDPA